MPNLADSKMCKQFVEALELCEANRRSNLLTNWDMGFITSMREFFDSREHAMDMGLNPWSPNVKQWNQLKQTADKFR